MGLENGKMIGRSVLAASCSTTSFVKLLGIILVPMRALCHRRHPRRRALKTRSLRRVSVVRAHELLTPAGSNKDIAKQPNTYRVPGTEYGAHNFGLLSVAGPKGQRVLTMRIMDKDGKEVWKREVTEQELQIDC